MNAVQRFAYEARRHDGTLTAGLIAADTIEKAGRLLAEQNLFVVRVAAERASSGRGAGLKGHATRAELAWQLTQMAVMIETGMRLSDTLESLSRQATKPRLRALLEHVSTAVHEGKSLSDAMDMFPRAFPPSLRSLIRASEMSGTMTSVLRRSSQYLMHELQTIRKVRGALMYPAFMFVACIGVTVVLLTFILPKFAHIFASRGAVLPAPTRMLMALSDACINYWYIWIIASGVACVAAVFWIRTPMGRRQRDWLLISVPPFAGVFNALYQCRTFRTLGVLLESGVSLVDALEIIQRIVTNVHYRELWNEVEENIQRGEPFAGALLESSLLPEHVSQMIDNGDQSGKLGLVFNHLATFVEDEYDRLLKTVTQFIEPAMIVVMGSIIGFVALALLLPLFQASRLTGG